MDSNKNIDRLFQEKLRDFEEIPPNIVWENIEAHLDGKKKRRIIPIWWRYTGAAVILLLITFSAFQYFNNTNNETIIVDIDNNSTPLIDSKNLPNNKINDNIIVSSSDNDSNVNQSTVNLEEENSIKEKPFKKEGTETNESIATVEKKKKPTTNESEKIEDLGLNDKYTSSKNNEVIAQNNAELTSEKSQLNSDIENDLNKELLKIPSEKSTDTNAIVNSYTSLSTDENQPKKVEEKTATEEIVYENLEDTLDDKYKLKEEEQVDQLGNRWSVATVVAPVFYNSFTATGSPLDLQFDNSPKQGSQSVSYGVKVGFKLNKKWSVQSGVAMVDMGYSVGDVYINPSPMAASRLENVDYTSTATILNISTQNIINSSQIETSLTEPITGSLNQEYGYIEVPLEMKYSLTNRRLGVHLIGGFSTLFLNSNTVYVETPEFSSELGEAKNLNDIDFSGNVGFDVDYNINKHLYINVAPMLKVYTNTFSKNYENSNNVKPYLFGVYTGLNYKF